MPPKKKTVQPKDYRKKKYKVEHVISSTSPKTSSFKKPINWLSFSIPFSFILFLSGILIFASQAKNKNITGENVKINKVSQEDFEFKKISLRESAPTIDYSAKGIYAQDLETGFLLFSKNADKPLLPASTTKIATALVALNSYRLNDIVTIASTRPVIGQTMGLKNGERINIENLLYGLLVYSANDAAEALAKNYPGGRMSFVDEMNKFSQKSGLVKTHFTNPVGYDEYLHFSTAQDMAKLASIGLQNELFAKIVSTENYNATSIDGIIVHPLVSTNQLLGKVDGVIGVKTGHTKTSGESLVTLVNRNNRKVLIAMLGSEDRFAETEKLIDWIYTNYEWGE